MQDTPPAPLPRPLLAVAIGLPVVLAVVVAVAGVIFSSGDASSSIGQTVTADRTGPLGVPAAPAPAAASAACSALLAALPAELIDGSDRLGRRELARPTSAGVVAWGNPRHDPVVLRCGIERPAELVATSELGQVNGVGWLRLPGQGASTWVAVDRPVYVALTVPDDSGTGPLQDVSTAVRTALAATKVDVGG